MLWEKAIPQISGVVALGASGLIITRHQGQAGLDGEIPGEASVA